MNSILKEMVLTFLYLTPIGYLLSLLNLFSGERTPDVYVHLPRNEPIKVIIKENPQITDRFHWFINGVVLVTQAYIIVANNLGGDFGHVYAWIALIFGVVNSISAFFPRLDWNNKTLKFINTPLIWVLLITSLIFVTVWFDIFHIGFWR